MEGGCIRSKGSSVLGADGKLAIAGGHAEAVERLMQEGEINRPIELFVYCVPGAGGLHGEKICGLFQDRERGGNCHRPLRDREVLTRTPARLYMNGTDWARRPCYPAMRSRGQCPADSSGNHSPDTCWQAER